MAEVELRGVSKVFPNGVTALEPVDLTIPDGELFALVGPSGSGKSTLLRLIAGLETPTTGTIHIGGRDVTQVAPRERNVAMVFQQPALYPHLTVFENLAFGLRARGMSRKELAREVDRIADLLRISDLVNRKPQTLSGGQKQRVALGRALVRKPAVFLLDEPMSSLDQTLRGEIRGDLIRLHRTHVGTMILVTHEQSEALAMGDRVGVMNLGRFEQAGRPTEAYERPASISIARSLGSPPINILYCDATRLNDDTVRLEVLNDSVRPAFTLPKGSWDELVARKSVALGLRPESLIWTDGLAVEETASVCWLSRSIPVVESEYQGHETITCLPIGEKPLLARSSGKVPIASGSSCHVGFRIEDAIWFDAKTGAAIPDCRPD